MSKSDTQRSAALADVPVTMSSREIAELCEKKHSHVLRDIRSMVISLHGEEYVAKNIPEHYRNRHSEYIRQHGDAILAKIMGDDPKRVHHPAYHWVRDKRGYISEFHLNKEMTYTLVSGYKVKLRNAIINRWLELEVKDRTPSHSIPQTFGDALRLAAEQADKIAEQEKRISVMEPDVAGFERIAKASGGSMCITNAAKVLQERPKDLFGWLSANGWIYRRTGAKSWTAYSDKCKSGHLEHKVTSITRGDGSEKVCESVRVTGKGLVRLAKEFGVTLPKEESVHG